MAQVFCQVVLALLVVAAQTNEAHAKHPDMILHGGRVFTSDTRGLWAEAVAIRDGGIIAVGNNDDVLKNAHKNTTLVDLGGRLVVPGFNDAHVHTTPYGNLINPTDFVPTGGPTVDEMLEYISAATVKFPPGTWLFGLVGETLLSDPRMDRFLLDSVAPNHPVTLLAWWGHGAFANTSALLAAGIAEDAADPLGGWYGRVPDTDILDGSLHEYASFRLSRLAADQDPIAAGRAALVAFAASAASLGITSFQDQSFYSGEHMQQVLAGVSLPVRMRNVCFPFDTTEPCPSVTLNELDSRVTWSGLKRILDGTTIEREAALNAPYSDAPTQFGRLNFPVEFLRSDLQQSIGLLPFYEQRIYHVVGDRTVDSLLTALDTAAPAPVWRLFRPRLEHGDLITPDLATNIRNHGIVVVQNPTHATWNEVLNQRLGARAASSHLSASLLHAGIPLAIGSDMSGQPFNPLQDLMFAVVHPVHPSEGLTLEEAVIAHTRGSAYAEFEEWRKGTLAPGMLADLAVFSQDIFTLPIQQIPLVHCVMTMVGGEVVFSTGELALPGGA